MCWHHWIHPTVPLGSQATNCSSTNSLMICSAFHSELVQMLCVGEGVAELGELQRLEALAVLLWCLVNPLQNLTLDTQIHQLYPWWQLLGSKLGFPNSKSQFIPLASTACLKNSMKASDSSEESILVSVTWGMVAVDTAGDVVSCSSFWSYLLVQPVSSIFRADAQPCPCCHTNNSNY